MNVLITAVGSTHQFGGNVLAFALPLTSEVLNKLQNNIKNAGEFLKKFDANYVSFNDPWGKWIDANDVHDFPELLNNTENGDMLITDIDIDHCTCYEFILFSNYRICPNGSFVFSVYEKYSNDEYFTPYIDWNWLMKEIKKL